MNFFGLFTKFLNTLTSVYKIIKETLIAEFEKLMVYKITIVEAAKQPKVIILFFFFIIIYLSLLPIYVFIYIFCFFY